MLLVVVVVVIEAAPDTEVETEELALTDPLDDDDLDEEALEDRDAEPLEPLDPDEAVNWFSIDLSSAVNDENSDSRLENRPTRPVGRLQHVSAVKLGFAPAHGDGQRE